MLRSIPNATHHTTQKLFWNTFPFCIELALPDISCDWSAFGYDYYETRRKQKEMVIKKKKIINDLIAICPNKDQKNEATLWKKVDLYFAVKFYFTNRDTANKFIDDAMQANLTTINSITAPSSDAHLEMLKADFKIVTRPTLFKKKYEWKITFKTGMSDESKEDLHEWIAGYFNIANKNNRYTSDEKNWTPVLYLRDEDDVLVAKLALSANIKKIEKAVVLNNNNNNTERTQNETRTIQNAR